MENHPNFKQSADYDQSKRLAIHEWFNLEEKITRLEQKRGIESQKESQEDINQKAQQSVDGWMNKQFTNERNTQNKNEKEDEVFF